MTCTSVAKIGTTKDSSVLAHFLHFVSELYFSPVYHTWEGHFILTSQMKSINLCSTTLLIPSRDLFICLKTNIHTSKLSWDISFKIFFSDIINRNNCSFTTISTDLWLYSNHLRVISTLCLDKPSAILKWTIGTSKQDPCVTYICKFWNRCNLTSIF